MARRWYQTLDVGDESIVYEDPSRALSKFWNEGKWDNFVKPLLPSQHQTFIEIGCNAGLFLKMAKDAGFKDVIGVEGNYQILKQALVYKEINGYDYKLVHERIGVNFGLDNLPLADVILIANMHYYLPIPIFSQLVDKLRNRCLYCLVVSARAKRRKGNALWDLSSIRGYFRGWQEREIISWVSTEGDPCPRETMYGVLFKGNLTPINVADYYNAWFEASKKPEHKSHGLAPAMQDFFEGVLFGGADFEHEGSSFYNYWREREPCRSEQWTRDWLDYKATLAKYVQANGMKTPIYFDYNLKLLDGIHRLCIAKLLGYEHILGRVL